MLGYALAFFVLLSLAKSTELMATIHAFQIFFFGLARTPLSKPFAIWLRTPTKQWILIHFASKLEVGIFGK